MNIKKSLCALFTAIALCTISVFSLAEPPEPELGRRWIINPLLSDEFNQEKLDKTKWFDFHPYWEGRPPARFLPSGVSVKDGTAQIRAQVLAKPKGPFTLGGGAIRSRAEVLYGYYEARIKASRIGMSSTFWMSNNKTPLLKSNYLGEDCVHDRWSNELDIIESVGNLDTLRRGRSFNKQQQFNSHIHYSSCDDKDDARFSSGVLSADDLNNTLPGERETSSHYNVYAAWWKDANQAEYYLNDQLSGRVDFMTDLHSKPFNRAMAINLVAETYNWAPPPSNDEAENSSINTVHYDWVRAYKSVQVDANPPSFKVDRLRNGGFEKGNFHDWNAIGTHALSIVDTNVFSGQYAAKLEGIAVLEYDLPVQKNTNYIFSGQVFVEDGNLRLGAEAISFNNTVPSFGEIIVNDTQNRYEQIDFAFNSGNQNSVRLYLRSNRSSKIFLDNMKLEALDDVTPPTYEGDVFREQIMFKAFVLNQDDFETRFTYKTDEDAIARLVLFKGQDIVARRGTPVKAGYGHMQHNFPLPELASLGVTSFRLDLLSPSDGRFLSSTKIIELP